MSLIAFHRFLIGTAIVFCLGYAIWEFDGGGARGVILGSIFTLLSVTLVVYLRHLGRFLGYEDRGRAGR
jgi:hypothetical protein